MVLRTLRTAESAAREAGAELEIRFDGGQEEAMRHWLGHPWPYRRQSAGDLGQRMAAAFEDSFREGSTATVMIGSDCPALTCEVLGAAFDSLRSHAVVFGPATDGGYYLIGLTHPVPELFHGVAWGTEKVLRQSLDILARNGEKPALLQPLDDLDRPEDLVGWRRTVEVEAADLGRVSVIIPTLNEPANVTAAIESARAGHPHEIIVVDGGSTDDTRGIAKAAGACVIQSGPGRARQMNAGAARASGNVLLFLHADTLLPEAWTPRVSETLARPKVAAGAFRFRIAEDFPGRWIVEWTTDLRSRWFQMPYGDQGLFLRRSVFEELGGYADLPMMEDYELVTRLRPRGRLVTLAEAVRTSGRRWRRMGVIRVTLINKLMIAGFRMGVSPLTLARWYRRA